MKWPKLPYFFKVHYFLWLDPKDPNISLGESIHEYCPDYFLEHHLKSGVQRRGGSVRVKWYFPMISVFGYRNENV